MKLHTHVKSPSYSLHPTIESVREVGEMSIIWMKLTPNIDEFRGIAIIGRGKNIFESCGFNFGVSWGFVPILFGIRKI